MSSCDDLVVTALIAPCVPDRAKLKKSLPVRHSTNQGANTSSPVWALCGEYDGKERDGSQARPDQTDHMINMMIRMSH